MTANTSAPEPALPARQAGAAALAQALQASRADTLATLAEVQRSLPSLAVPQRDTLNPLLWELGHIGWFQAYWLARFPQRHRGAQADPHAPRRPAERPQADTLYDSSHVPHASRWHLPLPSLHATLDDLAGQLQATLALLQDAGPGDDALYFYRLALFHEDMHHEAALYMAQSLGLPITDARWQPAPLPGARVPLLLGAGPFTPGHHGAGFAFDNELPARTHTLPASEIDNRVLTWADYLPFAEAGGYTQPQWWAEPGRAWLARSAALAPRYTRRQGDAWLQWRHGIWQPLRSTLPACHLTAFEAEAWCRWAGRRLPTEAEWERAALQRPGEFVWGQVWEWTASPFEPYPGFVPHPYRDYSAPWFGNRPVLRGASFMTQPRLRDARYRNFFMAHRNDVPAGFRTCRC